MNYQINKMEDYALLSSIQGFFHQGNIERFDETEGRQCSCITLFTIVFAYYKRLNVI